MKQFKAKKKVVDGILFDSTSEAEKYVELKSLERAGDISDLKCHTTYPLYVNGVLVGQYSDDFSYIKKGAYRRTVHEHKGGIMTDVYRLRVKVFQALYPQYEFIESGEGKEIMRNIRKRARDKKAGRGGSWRDFKIKVTSGKK